MNTKNKDVAVIEETQPPAVFESQSAQVMNSLTAAMDKGVDADSLEKILNMQERILDREAEQAYTSAMVAVQNDLPDIKKGEWNDQTKSHYESLEAMNRAIKPIYTKHGFSISFGTEPGGDADMIVVTADVMHNAGHKEKYKYPLPYDSTGIKGSVNKTKIHASGSTLTYGRRYLLKLIFNLTTADDIDDDGNSATVTELLTEDEIANIESLAEEIGTTVADFLKTTPYSSLGDIPRNRYKPAIRTLEAKRNAG